MLRLLSLPAHTQREKAYRDPIGIRIVEMRKQSPSLFFIYVYVRIFPPLQPACPNGEREKALLFLRRDSCDSVATGRCCLRTFRQRPFPFFPLEKFPAFSPSPLEYLLIMLIAFCLALPFIFSREKYWSGHESVIAFPELSNY